MRIILNGKQINMWRVELSLEILSSPLAPAVAALCGCASAHACGGEAAAGVPFSGGGFQHNQLLVRHRLYIDLCM
jgi:hypothetical protein